MGKKRIITKGEAEAKTGATTEGAVKVPAKSGKKRFNNY